MWTHFIRCVLTGHAVYEEKVTSYGVHGVWNVSAVDAYILNRKLP